MVVGTQPWNKIGHKLRIETKSESCYSINQLVVYYIEDITWPRGDTNFIFE